jgi:hypothetical protein
LKKIKAEIVHESQPNFSVILRASYPDELLEMQSTPKWLKMQQLPHTILQIAPENQARPECEKAKYPILLVQ